MTIPRRVALAAAALAAAAVMTVMGVNVVDHAGQQLSHEDQREVAKRFAN